MALLGDARRGRKNWRFKIRDSKKKRFKIRDGQSVDSTMVVSQVAQPEKPRLTELKGLIELTGHVFSERWTIFSGFAGPPKHDYGDLLIPKGLLARWRWRGGACLLNLKDLITVLPPNHKRVFESGPILAPLFWCRIVPNSAISCQNAAEYGKKPTFFATDFMRTGPRPCGSRAIPTGAEHKTAGRPKASPERPTLICRQAVTGGHEQVAGCLPIWLN